MDASAARWRWTPRSRGAAWVGGWATIVWVVVVWRPHAFGLLDPDEAHYAQITREMLRTGRWLVPSLDGAPYIDKPVLFHWLQGAFVRLIGESELALRLPSACAALWLFFVVWWMARRLFGGPTGHRAAVMFATLPLTFALASVGLFDMVFTAFLFTAVACLLVASLCDQPALEYAGWPLLALAVLTKGPVALLLVVLFGVALGAARSTRVVVSRVRWASGLAFVVVAAAPWFVYLWWQFPERFVRDYLLAGNLWYFTAPTEYTTRRSDMTFYVRTFLGAFFPWSAIALGRAGDVLSRWRGGQSLSVEERVLWTWLLVVMGFFTLAGFKLDTYIFPAAPAVAMLAAWGWQEASSPAAPMTERSWTRRAVLVVACVLIVAGVVTGAVIFRIDLGVGIGAAALPAALIGGGMLLAYRLRGTPHRLPGAPVVTVSTLLCVYVSVLLVGLPLLERSRPTASLGTWVRDNSRHDFPLGVLGLHDWRGSIRYYADRVLVPLDNPDDVRAFFDRQPDGYVMMRRRDYQALRAQGADLRAMGGRPAIVGRTGKYIRRQVWGRIVVVRRGLPDEVPTVASVDAELHLSLDCDPLRQACGTGGSGRGRD